MNEFYVIISSNHSKTYFNNTPSNFKVWLNEPLRFGEGWKVALCQYKSGIQANAYVCSDICTSTIVGTNQYNVLRHVSPGTHDYDPFYIDLSQRFVNYIQIYLIHDKTEERIISQEGDDATFVTLHFVHRPRLTSK